MASLVEARQARTIACILAPCLLGQTRAGCWKGNPDADLGGYSSRWDCLTAKSSAVAMMSNRTWGLGFQGYLLNSDAASSLTVMKTIAIVKV